MNYIAIMSNTLLNSREYSQKSERCEFHEHIFILQSSTSPGQTFNGYITLIGAPNKSLTKYLAGILGSHLDKTPHQVKNSQGLRPLP
jgi:hypothetical protein